MTKLEEIFKAWYLKGFGDEHVHEIAKERRAICAVCPHKAIMMGMDICGICHCPLDGKTYSPTLNACPKQRWKQ